MKLSDIMSALAGSLALAAGARGELNSYTVSTSGFFPSGTTGGTLTVPAFHSPNGMPLDHVEVDWSSSMEYRWVVAQARASTINLGFDAATTFAVDYAGDAAPPLWTITRPTGQVTRQISPGPAFTTTWQQFSSTSTFGVFIDRPQRFAGPDDVVLAVDVNSVINVYRPFTPDYVTVEGAVGLDLRFTYFFVPAPAAGGLAAMGGVLAMRRRRRPASRV